MTLEKPKASFMSTRVQQVQKDPTVLVTQALENPEYSWRTIEGISGETGLEPEKVQAVLSGLSSSIISVSDEHNRPLFTTRRHYKEKQPIYNRIISAISGVVK